MMVTALVFSTWQFRKEWSCSHSSKCSESFRRAN